jgi:hypothetical protein
LNRHQVVRPEVVERHRKWIVPTEDGHVGFPAVGEPDLDPREAVGGTIRQPPETWRDFIRCGRKRT